MPEPVAEVPPPVEAVAPVEVVAEESAPAVEPAPEPVAVEAPAPAAPASKKAWPVKSKRPRFVREQAERRDRPQGQPLPDRSTKLLARMMTQNLAVPPKEDPVKLPR